MGGSGVRTRAKLVSDIDADHWATLELCEWIKLNNK